jgi:hypothetical protein
MPDNTPHVPTDKSRAEVSALKSFGHTHEEIALFLDISEKSLVKYYKRELDTAIVKANAQVANKLFKKAIEENDLPAQIFWLKTRARWRTADKEQDIKEVADTLMIELKDIRAKLAEQNKSEY